MNYHFLLIPYLIVSLLVFSFGDRQISFAQSETPMMDSINQPLGDTTEVSLDWNGLYKGILPCADCEGIKKSIKLSPDKSYVIETTYLGKDQSPSTLEGTFTWNEAGNTITLSNTEAQPSQYFVGENMLIQLDMEGNKITGELADKYILEKVVMTTEAQFTDTRWQLVEIMGQKVTREDIYLIFNEEENTVSGFDGCNLFSGSYELKEGNRLAFGEMIATMRACPEMEESKEFMQLLKRTDNYALRDNVLSLHKAKMAPLLKFSATEAK